MIQGSPDNANNLLEMLNPHIDAPPPGRWEPNEGFATAVQTISEKKTVRNVNPEITNRGVGPLVVDLQTNEEELYEAGSVSSSEEKIAKFKHRSLSSCGEGRSSRSALATGKRSASEDPFEELCTQRSGEDSLSSRLNTSTMMLLMGKNNTLNYEKFTRSEVTFIERVMPLISGSNMYKKFSQNQLLNKNAFDPLNADKSPPDQCGFGIRSFCLDQDLKHIEIRQHLKPVVEQVILISDLVKPILPQTTMDILRVQKQERHRSFAKSGNNEMLEDFLLQDAKGSISQLVKIGIINKNSELFKQKCADCNYYPFSLALNKGRIELVATSYETLKNWIIGINILIACRKNMGRLRKMMQGYNPNS